MTNDSTGDYKNRNQKKARKHASYKKQDRSKKHKNISLNQFVPNATFIYPPENIRKPYGFLMFPRGRERVHWQRMG